ncbi:hypothetical protein, partial [Inhella proteolytica]|uniref:hypothetical protein n=1 Tax=Inhella proteolytica TaxID=2795029 RepID=UPI001E5D5AED
QGKHVLRQVDADAHNGHGLPLSSQLMRFRNPIVALVAVSRLLRAARDGEVPFIRWAASNAKKSNAFRSI